jgi:hypothetical protein
MPPQISVIPLGVPQLQALEFHSNGSNGWALLSPSDTSIILPAGLGPKVANTVLITSGSSSGSTYIVYNALRIDTSAGLVDQEPFAIVVSGGVVQPTMVAVHHGTWESRSFDPGPDFWRAVSASKASDYFLSQPPSGMTKGDLNSLPYGSRGAFEAAVSALQQILSGSSP